MSSPEFDPTIQPRRHPARRGPSLLVQAVLVTAVIVAALGGCLAWDRILVALLVSEGAPVESVQVVLLVLRVTHNRHIVTIHSSADGHRSQKYPLQMEGSGYNQNVSCRFLALKPSLYGAGSVAVTFRSFRYRSLD